MKSSFVTWQLRQLHAELNALDSQRNNVFWLSRHLAARHPERSAERDRAIRRILLDRLLRALPTQLGFQDARSFARAFARANHLLTGRNYSRRRLTVSQVQELERRILRKERAADIARVVGCAQQTVLNRAAELRKRLAAQHEQDAGGI